MAMAVLLAAEGSPATQGIVATPVALFLVQVMLIIILSRTLGYVLKRTLFEPLVIAEIIAGILLGPTAFGHIPGWMDYLFPASSLGVLNVFANVGLIFFMFLIGLELDPKLLQAEGKRAVVIACVCIGFPFAIGGVLSIYLYDLEPPTGRPSFVSFILFIGVAMSITAFPVLARIIADAGLLSSHLGTVTMAAAAVNDVIGWLILAFALSIASASSEPLKALWTVLETGAFVVAMVVLVRPLLTYGSKYINTETLSQPVVVFTFLMLFFSAWVTEAIGIHALFGAFVFGVIFPKKDMLLATSVVHIIEDMTVVFLLPLYFVKSGLKTDLGVLDNAEAWKISALVIVCATAGKVLGGLFSARLTGLNWRESISLGVLMNTRGLVELIVLNLGVELKVISVKLFAALVLMALLTTFATAPILRCLYTRDMIDRINKEKMLVVDDATFSIVMNVSSERSGGMVSLASALMSPLPKDRSALTVLHLTPLSTRPSAYMADMHRQSVSGSAVDRSIKDRLQEHGLLKMADILTYPSSDEKKDVTAVCSAKQASLVILPLQRSLTDRYAIQGGDIGRYLLANNKGLRVAVFLDKGLPMSMHRVLYAFCGPPSTILATPATKITRLLSRAPGVEIDVLQVVPLSYSSPLEVDQGIVGKKASKRFRLSRVVASGNDTTRPLIEEIKKGYDLVIVGMLPRKKEFFAPIIGRRNSLSRGNNATQSTPPTLARSNSLQESNEASKLISSTQFDFELDVLAVECPTSLLLVHNVTSDDLTTVAINPGGGESVTINSGGGLDMDNMMKESSPVSSSERHNTLYVTLSNSNFSLSTPHTPGERDPSSLPSTRAASPVTSLDDNGTPKVEPEAFKDKRFTLSIDLEDDHSKNK